MGAGTKIGGGAGAKVRFAAALAFASQLIHLWVLPEAFVARPLTGSFILLAAVFEGLLGASLLFGPGRWAVRLGLLLNATIVLAWTVTRVAGFPALLGFARLPVEPVGLVATVSEVALFVLLLKIGRELKTQPKNGGRDEGAQQKRDREKGIREMTDLLLKIRWRGRRVPPPPGPGWTWTPSRRRPSENGRSCTRPFYLSRAGT